MIPATVWVGLILVSCAAGTLSEPDTHNIDPLSVIGKTWQWVGTVTPVERIAVSAPEQYTIHLTTDKRVHARFDCNHGGGSYRIAPGKLSLGPLSSTRMACPPDSLDSLFLRDLQRVASYFIQDGSLYFELPYDSGTMRFRKAP